MSELEPIDAFPNARGLSEELGLTRRADGEVPPQYDEKGRRWLSICSRHQQNKTGCRLCAVGSYSDDKRFMRPMPKGDQDGGER